MGKADANRIDSETQRNYSLHALRMEEIVMKKAADFWALAEITASPLRPMTAGSFNYAHDESRRCSQNDGAAACWPADVGWENAVNSIMPSTQRRAQTRVRTPRVGY
jgi:hypothetical protein